MIPHTTAGRVFRVGASEARNLEREVGRPRQHGPQHRDDAVGDEGPPDLPDDLGTDQPDAVPDGPRLRSGHRVEDVALGDPPHDEKERADEDDAPADVP